MKKLFLLAILYFCLFDVECFGQKSDSSRIDSNKVSFYIKSDSGNNYDTVVFIHQLTIDIKDSKDRSNQLLTIFGIILTSITLMIVMINYRVDKLYGGWSNKSEYLRIKNKRKKLTKRLHIIEPRLLPVLEINPLDYVEKVKETDPGMFSYQNDDLKKEISKHYEQFDNDLKKFFSRDYDNLNRSSVFITHKIGYNNKFNDNREFFFMGAAKSFTESAKSTLKRIKDQIEDCTKGMNEIRLK